MFQKYIIYYFCYSIYILLLDFIAYPIRKKVMFIDTHCHINRDTKEAYIKHALDNNVGIMLCAGDTLESSLDAISIANDPHVFACVGIHPEHAYTTYDMSVFKELLNNENVKAIGEIGLDYHYTKDNKEKQISMFEDFLKLAEEYNLPVVVHSRNATDDTIRILKKYHVKGVIHCFSGSIETAREYIKLGFSLGIGGVLTFKNSRLFEVIKEIPLSYIVLETDSPFLSPEPYRGIENESKNLPIIAECLAKHLGVSVSEVEEITTSNARKIFDI